MPNWTIAFDATLAVHQIDAETEDEAREKAEQLLTEQKIVEAVNEYLNREDGVCLDLSVSEAYLVRNEETGEQMLAC